ncbi:NAD(P)/FAD-dependent oxidoreductase [Pyruvatibacter sp. HU-CL02332]|uniref:flavin-containing monooxygenase n=1 Tax=Pyruvatibacter sp. HU-CL02332 TaxID=3127650 RepID=UPI003105969A
MTLQETSITAKPEHIDVLIVGAGISGVGAGYHLKANSPGKSFAILEGRETMGGTWDLFKYPGIRSDSDMYTLGYSFRPWTDPKAIADGPSILKYVKDTAREHGIDKHIRFSHKVISADWSTPDALWHIKAERGPLKEPVNFTANFLFMCGGYYNYDEAFTPDFEGREDFKGEVIHPQFWPEDMDYSGKKVVVIGSGATAMTLVPSMTDKAAHVTMLQRTPTYVVSRPGTDAFANFMRKYLPSKLAYGITRWKNVLMGMYFYRMCMKQPAKVKDYLLGMVREEMGDEEVKKHFTPTYNPWDQRVCLVPDSDLYGALKSGKASVVTDHIDRFTENGIKLKSGETLDADIIVTATGLKLQVWNGLDVSVDGKLMTASDTMAYKGFMYSGIPNMASSFGYTNASWTLKCDLTCEYVCRLLNHMDAKGLDQATPSFTEGDVEVEPWLDLKSGYVQRAMESFPKQGSKTPWKLHQNYAKDLVMLRFGSLHDDGMVFSKKPAAKAAAAPTAIAAE